VAQTGVQFLFAFLLTAPLQARFSGLDGWGKSLLIVDVAALAVSAVCLIAPVAWHRALFRLHLKDEVVEAANRLAQAGLTFLAIGMVLSVTLTIGLVTARWIALTFGAGIAVLTVFLWLALPVRHRRALPE